MNNTLTSLVKNESSPIKVVDLRGVGDKGYVRAESPSHGSSPERRGYVQLAGSIGTVGRFGGLPKRNLATSQANRPFPEQTMARFEVREHLFAASSLCPAC